MQRAMMMSNNNNDENMNMMGMDMMGEGGDLES